MTARPPNLGCKSDGRPNDEDIEPVDCLGSQIPRRTTGPPTGPQHIVSLPYLDIHMLPPGQPRIQDYDDILERPRAT